MRCDCNPRYPEMAGGLKAAAGKKSLPFFDPVEIPNFPCERLHAVEATENGCRVGALSHAVPSTSADV